MPGIRSDFFASVPGYTDPVETYENAFRWGREGLGVFVGGLLSGAARDAGNTPTTRLRPGLIVGQISASGKLKEYSPTATDGSQLVHSILMVGVATTDLDASNVDRLPWFLGAGPVQASRLLNLDNVARKQMRGRFLFDDDLPNRYGWGTYLLEVPKTANYTIVAGDAGTLFTNTGAAGAVTFTLPALAAGAGPFDFLVTAGQNVTVASAAGDDVIAFNDASADSLTFSTAGQLIGGRLRVYANAAGTKWYVENLSQGNTITVAT